MFEWFKRVLLGGPGTSSLLFHTYMTHLVFTVPLRLRLHRPQGQKPVDTLLPLLQIMSQMLQVFSRHHGDLWMTNISEAIELFRGIKSNLKHRKPSFQRFLFICCKHVHMTRCCGVALKCPTGSCSEHLPPCWWHYLERGGTLMRWDLGAQAAL